MTRRIGQRIGTPLGPAATRLMLLGAGELGKEVIIALQRLGVEVIAVDRYPNAPGQQVAHRAHVIDMTDGAALAALVAAERPAIIVPEIEAIATDALADIERTNRAEVIPTARAAQLTMNREGIRRLAAEELGLPTSPYAFAASPGELRAAVETGVGYPCVVKPVMSSSGKGQSVLKSAADLMPTWEYAMAAGRVKSARVIVEGFVKFDYEITLLTVRAIASGSGTVKTSFCEPIGHLQVSGDYVESWQPQPMSALALQRARDAATRLTGALGGRGVFGVEFFVGGDEIWFSEVSPRPHDTGLVTLGSQRLSEFELHARAILGLPVDTTARAPGASAVIYGGLDEADIAFEGVAEALAVPESDLRLFGKPESFSKRRMGVAFATGASVEEARERARETARRVRPVSGVRCPVSGVRCPVSGVRCPVSGRRVHEIYHETINEVPMRCFSSDIAGRMRLGCGALPGGLGWTEDHPGGRSCRGGAHRCLCQRHRPMTRHVYPRADSGMPAGGWRACLTPHRAPRLRRLPVPLRRGALRALSSFMRAIAILAVARAAVGAVPGDASDASPVRTAPVPLSGRTVPKAPGPRIVGNPRLGWAAPDASPGGSRPRVLPGLTVTRTAVVSYRCERGMKVSVVYLGAANEQSFVSMPISGKTWLLVDTPAASGVRYVGGRYVWWSNGRAAQLYAALSNPNAPALWRDCMEISAPSAARGER